MTTPRPTMIGGPAVWKGDALWSRADAAWSWTDDEIRELVGAVRGVSGQPLEAIAREDFQLPRLGHRLQQVQDRLENGSGITVMRRWPVEDFSQEDNERLFWGLALHLGTPLSQSARGERIFHVRDAGLAESDPRARGPNTKKRLSFHTDRCDVIGFLCLRQAREGGENRVVSSAALYNEMQRRRPELLDVLCEPFYYQRHNVDQGNALPYCRQPVFSFQDGHFAGCFLRVLIERAYEMPELPDMTDEQREALDYLEQLAEDPTLHVHFFQQPGDLLFLNNWTTFHRRDAFVDHELPAQRRHLLRIWLAMPNSRPIDPLFRDNYGATEAGAIRGGMRPATGNA